MDAAVTAHPLDQATELERVSEGSYRGRTSPLYANMNGPFGGVTAATLLRGVVDHPGRQGPPVAFTINYSAPIRDGAFEVGVRLVRAGKTTQHWLVELSQDGGPVAAFASVVCAAHRPTWSHQPAAPPQLPDWQTVEPSNLPAPLPWLERYEFRYVEGAPVPFAGGAERPRSALSRLYLRDRPERELDFVSLAALSDAFIVRILHARGNMTPVATVTMTTYLFADEAMLARQGAAPLPAIADAHVFKDGLFNQTAELWSTAGELLATSTQLCWFKD